MCRSVRPAATRAIFSKVMPVHQLPPGKYVLRAMLSAGGAPVKTLTRGFEIAAAGGADDVRRRSRATSRPTPNCFCRSTTTRCRRRSDREPAVDATTLDAVPRAGAAGGEGRVR